MPKVLTQTIQFAAVSEVNGRKSNDDRLFAGWSGPGGDESIAVCCVADGVAACANGKDGADIVVETFCGALHWLETVDREAIRQSLDRWSVECRQAIAMLSHDIGGDAQTTFTGVCLYGDESVLVHIGDTRAYWYSGGKLHRLTRDDTHAQLALDRGVAPQLIRPTDHRALTKCINGSGRGDKPAMVFDSFPASSPGWLLVSSDGMHDWVSDRSVAAIVSGSDSAQTCARRLVDSAIAYGSTDNVSVAVVKLGEPAQARRTPRRETIVVPSRGSAAWRGTLKRWLHT